MSEGILFALAIIIFIGFFALLTVSKGRNGSAKNKLQKLKEDMYRLKQFDKSLSPSERRDILVQMDSVFSRAMSTKLYNNQKYADNLIELKAKYDRDLYNDIWESHKKRNRVVHESEDVDFAELKKYSIVLYRAITKL